MIQTINQNGEAGVKGEARIRLYTCMHKMNPVIEESDIQHL